MKIRSHTIGLLGALLAAACGGGNNNPTVECKETADCDLSAGGMCLVNESTGNKWCAYSDQDCPSGYRFSTFGTGDGVAGACVRDSTPDGGVDAPPMPTLTVAIGGSGTGHVTSKPDGIDCPGICSANFGPGTKVTLTQTPSSSVFLSWSDDCSGNAGCVVTLDHDKKVGALFGIPASNVWLRQTSASASGSIQCAKFMSNGDVIVGGYFGDTMKLGASTVTAIGGTDGFVARLKASDGSPVWIKLLGGSSNNDGVAGVDVDSNGDVVAVGLFAGTAIFNGINRTSSGPTDAFAAKLNGTNGNYLWASTFGGTGVDYAEHVGVDPSGNVLVTGTFEGSMTLGTQITSAGMTDVFLAKLAGSNGTVSWSKPIGGTDNDGDFGLGVDGSGNVVVAGMFRQTVNFGAGAVTSAGQSDAFVAKYASANGAYLTAKVVGNTNVDKVKSVAVDPAGNMYVAGEYSGTLDVGGATPLTSVSSNSDVYVVKYSIAGAHLWSKSYGNANIDIVHSIALDSAGNLLLSGGFFGTVSFGGVNLSAAGASDIFVAHLKSTDGSHLASIRLGGTGSENSWAAIGDASRQVFVAGFFTGFSEFGGVALTAPGADGFALLLTPLD